ncbi:MAG: hypothetical protein JJD98_05795, partial [Polaromonas sp.]|nr:hypothetical protein [Polaromonas sp.]
MTAITSTELGATGRYINLGASLAHDNVGPQTLIAYLLPADQTVLGYVFAKGNSGGSGPRFVVNTSEALNFGVGSTGAAISPDRSTTTNLSVGTWVHVQSTWTGSLTGTDILHYFDAGAAEAGTASNGSGSQVDDSANSVYLLNRVGLGREFIGTAAYIARWNRILSDAERTSARDNGPLSVPDGLILCWANQQDYGPLALTPVSRSTFAGGALPPNTALGDPAGVTVAPSVGHLTFTGYVPSVSTMSAVTVAPATGHLLVTGYAPVVTTTVGLALSDAYERSSVNLAASSISGTGDAAIISIKPKLQESEVTSSQTRWLEPSVDVTGVNGLRPTFRFLNYFFSAEGALHGTWSAGRRTMYSYDDGATWQYIDTALTRDATNQWIEFRNSTPFTQDKVRISRSRQITVHQAGDWLAAKAAAYSFFVPTATATAWTPTGAVSSYAAQSFIADEFSPQTDSLGATIAATPFYAAEINDTSLPPLSGNPKRLAAMVTGEHAAEDHGDLVFQSTVNWLCGASAEAVALRREYRILLYPCINAPGRAGGGWRGSWTQGLSGYDDPNRHVNQSNTTLEVIDKPKAAMNSDRAGVMFDWLIDFHGTFRLTWAGYPNAGDAFHTRFSTLINANSGYTHADGGDDAEGMLANYWRSLGTKFSFIGEYGDDAPITDTQMLDYGGAVVKSVNTMMAEGLFFIAPAAGHLGFTGYVPDVSVSAGVTVAPATGHLTLTGYAPTVVNSITVAPATGHAAFTGHIPSVDVGNQITIAPLAGHA